MGSWVIYRIANKIHRSGATYRVRQYLTLYKAKHGAMVDELYWGHGKQRTTLRIPEAEVERGTSYVAAHEDEYGTEGWMLGLEYDPDSASGQETADFDTTARPA